MDFLLTLVHFFYFCLTIIIIRNHSTFILLHLSDGCSCTLPWNCEIYFSFYSWYIFNSIFSMIQLLKHLFFYISMILLCSTCFWSFHWPLPVVIGCQKFYDFRTIVRGLKRLSVWSVLREREWWLFYMQISAPNDESHFNVYFVSFTLI